MSITCKVIRTKRKTLALQVHKDGSVIVRAPHWTLNTEISNFVEKMKKWIEKQQKYFQNLPEIHTRSFDNESRYHVLGVEYPIDLVPKLSSAKPSIHFDNKFIIACSSVKSGKALLEKWYRKEARGIFKERLDMYAKTYNMPYKNLKLSSARTRWGSCSRQKNINLTWRLVMAPLHIIDYVIAHELSHTIHMDHSKKFWAHLESIMPNHEEYKKWLKDNGRTLRI